MAGGGRLAPIEADEGALAPLEGRLAVQHGAFGDGDDAAALAGGVGVLHAFDDLIDIEGYLRQNDGVCPAGDARKQGQPARFIAHHLHEDGAAVAVCRGAHPLDGVGDDVERGMEAEGVVGAVDVVIDGLGKADDVIPLRAQQRRRAVGARPAQGEQAVQPHLAVIGAHLFQTGGAVFFGHGHHLEGGAHRPEHGAAHVEQALELFARHGAAFAADEAAVTVGNADDLGIFDVLIHIQADAAHDGIQPGAVAAACQDPYLHGKASSHDIFPPRGR